MPTSTTLSVNNQKGFGFILLIIFISLLIIGISGSAYYYLEILMPAQYAKAVIPIYDAVRSEQPYTGNLNRSNNYEEVLAIFDQFQTSFTKAGDKLSDLKPSPLNNVPSILANTQRSQQVQEDFTKILEFYLANISKAKRQTQFMIKAKELFVLLRPDLTTYPPKAVPEGQGIPLPPPPSTVGEFLVVWEVRIPKAKVVAEELFNQPVDLGEVSFDELKSLWQETVQGYALFIPFLKRQNPNLTLSEVQNLIPEGEKAAFTQADDAADKFLPLLEKALIRNSAENILRYQFEFDNSKKEEFETRFVRLDKNIKQLKEKYGQ